VNQKAQFIIVGIIFVSAFVLLGIILSPKKELVKPESSFSFAPSVTPQAPSPTQNQAEPVITSWRTYTNNDYEFAIDVPTDWKEQEFKKPDQKGIIVAFSPNSLPCETCTYFYDGYYSVRVFNSLTDPEYYIDYQKRKALIGKDPNYRQVQLGNSSGVFSGNKVALEHEKYVYELSFDKDQGKANISDSKIFQNAASTFHFTSLQFIK
jgi:hypothetical protein